MDPTQQFQQLMNAHSELLVQVEKLTRALQIGPPKRLYQKIAVTIPLQASGSKVVNLPFAPLYLGMVNESSVPVSVSEGRVSEVSSGSVTVSSGGQQAIFLQEDTREVTLAWTATPNSGAQTVILYVSTEPLLMFSSDVQISSSQSTIPVTEQGGLIYGPTHVQFSATDFDTTSLIIQPVSGVWHRNARGRYVQVVNNLSVSIEVYLVPFDSLGNSGVPVGLTQGASAQSTVAAGDAAQFGYSSTALMDSPLDSFYLGVTPSATGATGSLDVYYIETA